MSENSNRTCKENLKYFFDFIITLVAEQKKTHYLKRSIYRTFQDIYIHIPILRSICLIYMYMVPMHVVKAVQLYT